MPSDQSGIVFIGWAREDRAHDDLVKTLARRVVIEGASWPIADHIEHMWTWAGPTGEPEFKLGSELRIRAPSGRRLRLHGKIAGQSLAPEARMYRNLLHAFDQASPRPQLVVLARDGDGRSDERRRGFSQVVEHLHWPFAVILAMPEPESEAWYVCGFDPCSPDEHTTHATLTRELSFDPVTAAHRLTSRPNDASTDAKRVLAILCPERARRAECLADLAVLEQRGAQVGLARLITELRVHLLPLLDPAARADQSP